MDFLAEPALGSDPEAVADDQHPDHQLRVDRGPPDLAVERPQMRAESRQVDDAVNRPEQMISWDVSLQAELVEQRFLRHPPFAHHPDAPPSRGQLNQDFTPAATPTFSTESAHLGLPADLVRFSEADMARRPLVRQFEISG